MSPWDEPTLDLPARQVVGPADLALGRMAPRFRRIFAYWQEKRGGRAMPARRDLDPCDIPDLLPNLVLLDVEHDPLDFRYRLIGSAVRERVSRDYRGIRLRELPHQRPGTRFWENYAAVVRERAPFFGDVTYVGPDRNVGGAQDFLLPLSSDGETVDMILAVVEFELRLAQPKR